MSNQALTRLLNLCGLTQTNLTRIRPMWIVWRGLDHIIVSTHIIIIVNYYVSSVLSFGSFTAARSSARSNQRVKIFRTLLQFAAPIIVETSFVVVNVNFTFLKRYRQVRRRTPDYLPALNQVRWLVHVCCIHLTAIFSSLLFRSVALPARLKKCENAPHSDE